MRFGKIKMFFLLNGLVGLIFLLYFLPWIFSGTTNGKIITPYESNKIHVQYFVNDKTYYESYLRSGIEFSKQMVQVRYLKFHPQTSRVNSFMGIWAEPLGWWGVFLLASAMLLLTQNAVFSKGTIFQLHKKFPWISMEEYFPFPNGTYFNWNEVSSKEDTSNQTTEPTHHPPLLKNE